MRLEEYLLLFFSIVYSAIMLFVKEKMIKYLASLYAVSFLLLYTSYYTEMYIKNYTFFSYTLRFLGIFILAYTFIENVKIVRTLRKLQKRIYIDPLTGVYNRKFLEEIFKFEVEKYKKFKTDFCLLFVDLNNFKLVNDTYGHEEGDKILRSVAKLLKENVRENDYVIRYGGDEFIIITEIPHENILKLVERLTDKLNINYKGIKVTASVGVACYNSDGKDLKTLIKVADERMYKVKRHMKKMEEGIKQS